MCNRQPICLFSQRVFKLQKLLYFVCNFRTLIPSSSSALSTTTPATYDAAKHHYKNPIMSVNINSSSTFMGATITTATTTTAMTINALPKQQQSHIPSYHGSSGTGVGGGGGSLEHYRQQQQRSNSFKQQQHQRQYQHQQQQQQQPSQLPQNLNQYTHSSNATISSSSLSSTGTATAATVTTSLNNYQGTNIAMNSSRTSGSNTGSGSSSATSSSPLSPPSVSYNLAKDDTKLVNEMNKLYRKSPFMQKKLNGSSYNRYNASPGDESPKKESVLSSIGKHFNHNNIKGI